MFKYLYSIDCYAYSDIWRNNYPIHFYRYRLDAADVSKAVIEVIKEANQRSSYDAKFRSFQIKRCLVTNHFLIKKEIIFKWQNPNV